MLLKWLETKDKLLEKLENDDQESNRKNLNIDEVDFSDVDSVAIEQANPTLQLSIGGIGGVDSCNNKPTPNF